MMEDAAIKSPEPRPSSRGGWRQDSGGSLSAIEAAMREEIRELHEQRAAAMMTEIVDLQKERDLALAKVRRLEQKVKDVAAEAERRRESEGRAELVALLQQALMEEQLLSSDLRKKLQTLRKQNQSLTQLRNETLQTGNEANSDSPSNGWRRSLNSGAMSSPSTRPPASPLTPKGQTSSPGYSPTVVPRRYKLATATISCDVSTQTDQSDHSSADNEATPSSDPLKMAQFEIGQLQRELEAERETMAEERKRREEANKSIESLQLECVLVRESLSQLSGWVRERLRSAEEDMDIFRVIYSLHGSLSQEQSVLEDMRGRVSRAELRAVQLEQANRQLVLEASEAEERYRNSLSQIRKLQGTKCLSLPRSSVLTPPLTSRTMGGRKFSSPQLLSHHHIPSSSPLTTHMPSPHDIV